MHDKQLIVKITIDNYIRKVQLSKAQRSKYYEWDGVTIKCGSKKLLQKYINPIFKDEIIRNDGNVNFTHLKPEYCIVGFKGDKVYSVILIDGYEVILIEAFTEKQKQKETKYILCNVHYNDEVDLKKYTYTKVIANETQAGTPKEHIINGQAFYNQTLSPFARIKVMETIKEMYYNKFDTIDTFKLASLRETIKNSYPIMIEMEVVDTIKSQYDNTKKGDGKRWDVGNRAEPYMKGFLDFLTNGYSWIDEKGKEELLLEPLLEDDDRLHIASGNNSYFTPIKEGETPKLVFHFYQDVRPIWKTILKS